MLIDLHSVNIGEMYISNDGTVLIVIECLFAYINYRLVSKSGFRLPQECIKFKTAMTFVYF